MDPESKRVFRGEGRSRLLYQCKRCPTICKNFVEFRPHFMTHLKETDKDISVVRSNRELYNRLYQCKPCNKILNEDEIGDHRKWHNDDVHEVCDTCGKVFTSRGAWSKHYRTHEANKVGGTKHQCKLCGKMFALIGNLKTHIKFHSKERPYICEVCGKGFKERNAVIKHRKIHSNTKPFTCQYCGKGFIQPYRLREHMRTHTGEKPFPCEVCKSAFGVKQALKVHMKTAHGIDLSKTLPPTTVQEFDGLNPNDPKMYMGSEVKVTTEDETVAISIHQKTDETPKPPFTTTEERNTLPLSQPVPPSAQVSDSTNAPGLSAVAQQEPSIISNFQTLHKKLAHSDMTKYMKSTAIQEYHNDMTLSYPKAYENRVISDEDLVDISLRDDGSQEGGESKAHKPARSDPLVTVQNKNMLPDLHKGPPLPMPTHVSAPKLDPNRPGPSSGVPHDMSIVSNFHKLYFMNSNLLTSPYLENTHKKEGRGEATDMSYTSL